MPPLARESVGVIRPGARGGRLYIWTSVRGHHGGTTSMRGLGEQHVGAGRARDDTAGGVVPRREVELPVCVHVAGGDVAEIESSRPAAAVSYTHLRAHETRHDLVCRLLL